MSNRALTWAWSQKTGGPALKGVLTVLADLADEDHSCWPSMEYIGDKVEVSERSVRRHLTQLEEAGLLLKVRRDSGFGNRLNDRFVLNVDGQFSTTHEATGTVNESGSFPLPANLAGSGKTPDQKQPAKLAASGSTDSALAANCGRYMETPHEIDDYIINQAHGRASDATDLAPAVLIDETAPRSDDDLSVFQTVNRDLEKIHPSLSVEAITVRLRIADAGQVDLVRAAAAVVERASKPISSYPAFVATGIDRAPEAWPVCSAPSAQSPAERERAEREACTRGEHDWGPEAWGERVRAHCVRCSVPRRQVDSVFADLEDDFSAIGGGR